MPSNTPKGFPYPLPTEPLADGADAIKNLATTLDTYLDKPSCKVRRDPGGNVNVATGGWAIPQWDTVDFQSVPGMWSAANPARIIIPRKGVYVVGAQCSWAYNAAGSRQIQIVRNGTIVTGFSEVSPTVGNAFSTHQSVPANTFSFLAGDYIEAWLWQNSGVALAATIGAGNYYTGLWCAYLSA